MHVSVLYFAARTRSCWNLPLRTAGSRRGLHRTWLSIGLRSSCWVELLRWTGLGRRGTGFLWRAGLRFSSSLGLLVWMWLGYHCCRCWSPKWGWRGVLQRFSSGGLCCCDVLSHWPRPHRNGRQGVEWPLPYSTSYQSFSSVSSGSVPIFLSPVLD